MTENKLLELINSHEHDCLDFKEVCYDFQDNTKTVSFIKDVISMANTPRCESAYILFGVKDTLDSANRIVGLDRSYDDNDFQTAFGKAEINARPDFVYYEFMLKRHIIGILEIKISWDGPFFLTTKCKGDIEKIEPHEIYRRYGSHNRKCIGNDRKAVYNWFASKNHEIIQPQYDEVWEDFVGNIHLDDPDYGYVLITDGLVEDDLSYDILSVFDWDAIVDFNNNSDVSGLYNQIKESISKIRPIHLKRGKDTFLFEGSGLHWYLACSSDSNYDDHKEWLRKDKEYTVTFIKNVSKKIRPRKIHFFWMWNDSNHHKHMNQLMSEVFALSDDSDICSLVSEYLDPFKSVTEYCTYTYRLRFYELLRGLESEYNSRYDSISQPTILLPCSSGAMLPVEDDVVPWLSEVLDFVHEDNDISNADIIRKEFRMGSKATWLNLQLSHDCRRDITRKVIIEITNELRRKSTVRMNLYHEPGAGGTTIAYRIMWEMHTTYPTVIMNKCNPEPTVERFHHIYSHTKKPILIIIESENHLDEDIANVYQLTKSNNIPAVFLQVTRRFTAPIKSSRSYFVCSELNDNEASEFYDKYSQDVPYKKQEFSSLRKRDDDRTAFVFGLTAYEDNFRGIKPYVSSRVSFLNEDQKKLLVYISIGTFYAHKGIPKSALDVYTGSITASKIGLEEYFIQDSKKALTALVNIDCDYRYSIIHYSVARVILQSILTEGPLAKEDQWKYKLSTLAKEFIKFCSISINRDSDLMKEIVTRTIIDRNRTDWSIIYDSVDTKYSALLNDIPSNEGRMQVMKFLTDTYPNEAHFLAHYARLLSHNKDFINGLEYANKAIDIEPNSAVLHHIKGMVYRNLIKQYVNDEKNIEDIAAVIKLAQTSFEKSREIDRYNEYAYTSEAEMLIYVIDWIDNQKKLNHRKKPSEIADYLTQLFNRVEDLLESLNTYSDSESTSRYYKKLKARMKTLYGDYSDAISDWNNMLGQDRFDRFSIRKQLVRAYFYKYGSSWERLPIKELNRMIDLMIQNLEEKPGDERTIYMWINAIRYISQPPNWDSLIEKLTYWKIQAENKLEATYYLFIMHFYKAISGSNSSKSQLIKLSEDLSHLSRTLKDRHLSREWLGNGDDIRSLIKSSRLGSYDPITDFWENTSLLRRFEGRIKKITAIDKGYIDFDVNVSAYFVPIKSGMRSGRDENKRVTCYIGFSYDGLRAWEVKFCD